MGRAISEEMTRLLMCRILMIAEWRHVLIKWCYKQKNTIRRNDR